MQQDEIPVQRLASYANLPLLRRPSLSDAHSTVEKANCKLRLDLLECSFSSLVDIVIKLVNLQPKFRSDVESLVEVQLKTQRKEPPKLFISIHPEPFFDQKVKEIPKPQTSECSTQTTERFFDESLKEKVQRVAQAATSLSSEVSELRQKMTVMQKIERNSFDKIAEYLNTRNQLVSCDTFNIQLKLDDIRQSFLEFKSWVLAKIYMVKHETSQNLRGQLLAAENLLRIKVQGLQKGQATKKQEQDFTYEIKEKELRDVTRCISFTERQLIEEETQDNTSKDVFEVNASEYLSAKELSIKKKKGDKTGNEERVRTARKKKASAVKEIRTQSAQLRKRVHCNDDEHA
eukprot:TRINITY_DN5726_c0_g1_i15.p1 TRINITY_DN5726_c0_g1~~TRINITY_DN5726_c0_g1_i15.p1  ORF type:complete len:346 (+),score=65.04 TRINITY_DN5726_c0_g1_i15:124-1161(+)